MIVLCLCCLSGDVIKNNNSQSRRDLNQFASHVSSPEKKDASDSDPTQNNAVSSATPRRTHPAIVTRKFPGHASSTV